MNILLIQLGRFALTATVVAIAGFAGEWLWIHYHDDPWTRDGRVRADVVQVAPDVAGWVTQVAVHDNQRVRKGQLLFMIDQPRYAIALRQAEAVVVSDRASLAEAQREDQRDRTLGELVGAEARQQSATRVNEAEAALTEALANRDGARLNLERTSVSASVDGVVTNLELRPGDYLSVGRPALALVDTGTLRVDGYFEETKLRHIRVGDRASVRIMGVPTLLYGHVQGIAAGIEDRERGLGGNLLSNVDPTFNWVRLAQRIPVRVELDTAPPDIRLISGRTATVTVLEPTTVHTPAEVRP
ncbi:efflux RND transporter periplasmic adaptor subunit [Pararobbsia alpina]|uniref:p-hydroxybenzoic acid efflux pump subunit AaeA n=1 Tax=Pararobbsia alpina TaxID=621374 RepID=A0A6S7BGT4_9BURK|nr:HlyD family secretion protein [Pararobbsia alpina]CAB3799874.1 p-hydroxybenzoic acid efflux pump subunit AaeA [Pararobbsia alpina]